MARLAGMVQGVVVQMTIEAPAVSLGPPDTTGNRTQMVTLLRSWYSTSASARAVFSTVLHITGRNPR